MDAFENDATDQQSIDVIKRALHTLKGGARLSNLKHLGDLTHDFETFLVTTPDHEYSPLFFDQLHDYQDLLAGGVRALKRYLEGDDTENQQLMALPDGASVGDEDQRSGSPQDDLSSEPFETEITAVDKELDELEFTEPLTSRPDDAFEPIANPVFPTVEKKAKVFSMPTIASNAKEQESMVLSQQKSNQPKEFVRVPADVLEELVNLAGETSISRSRLEQQITDFGLSKFSKSTASG